MTRITVIDILRVDLPPPVPRSDAIQSFVVQETPMVRITCDDGSQGVGYSYTIGTGGPSIMKLIVPVGAMEVNSALRMPWVAMASRTSAPPEKALINRSGLDALPRADNHDDPDDAHDNAHHLLARELLDATVDLKQMRLGDAVGLMAGGLRLL